MKYLRLLFWGLTFQAMWLLGRRRVQVIGKDGGVHHGWASHAKVDHLEIFVLYWDVTSSDYMNGVFVSRADENVRWIRGWDRRDVKALLSAQALS